MQGKNTCSELDIKKCQKRALRLWTYVTFHDKATAIVSTNTRDKLLSNQMIKSCAIWDKIPVFIYEKHFKIEPWVPHGYA